jgi:lipoyl(octanoyl) transferase
MRKCHVRELGRMDYARAFDLQQELVRGRKDATIPDQLLLLEHSHVITMGRNGHDENLLAPVEILERAGISFHTTDRGGDVTYHGPGQLVGYPILDLREWKRDVGAYMRAIEQVIIDTLADFTIAADRREGMTGVWTGGSKIAAMGVHLSRWVTSHGFALNVSTDLAFFKYIVPCGLSLPVTSMAEQGAPAPMDEVRERLAGHFGRIFDCEMMMEAAELI